MERASVTLRRACHIIVWHFQELPFPLPLLSSSSPQLRNQLCSRPPNPFLHVMPPLLCGIIH